GDATNMGDILTAGGEAAVLDRLRAFREAGGTGLSGRGPPFGPPREARIPPRARAPGVLASLWPARGEARREQVRRSCPRRARGWWEARGGGGLMAAGLDRGAARCSNAWWPVPRRGRPCRSRSFRPGRRTVASDPHAVQCREWCRRARIRRGAFGLRAGSRPT